MALWIAILGIGAAPIILWWSFSSARVDRQTSMRVAAGLDPTVGASQIAGGRRPKSLAGLIPALDYREVESKLSRAGLTGKVDPRQVATMQLLTFVAGAAGALLFVATFGPSAVVILVAAFLVLLGAVAPTLWLNRKASGRLADIVNSLPDALDQLSILTRAGLGLQPALNRTALAIKGPLSEELGRTIQDLEIGLTREESFTQLVKRTGAPDIKRLVISLEQAAAVGAPIADVLDAQASHLRNLRELRAEERAQRLPVLLSLPLVLCILPTLFLVILGPAMLRIMQSWSS